MDHAALSSVCFLDHPFARNPFVHRVPFVACEQSPFLERLDITQLLALLGGDGDAEEGEHRNKLETRASWVISRRRGVMRGPRRDAWQRVLLGTHLPGIDPGRLMTNIELGYAMSSEEHAPLALVEHAAAAEAAGFSFAMISDHFHPWLDSQGQSPFVWSVLGGIATRTETLRVGTGVTCPLIRVHPAIVAQAAATSAAMLPGRFFLGVGTGENLNEHVLGSRWPAASLRREMLEEAVEVMRELWRGELTTHRGTHYTVEDARLYTLPEEPIEVMVAAGGPEAAKLAARIGDGLVGTSPDTEILETFTSAGGSGPRFGQVTVCWAPTREEAVRISLEQWSNAGLKGPLAQELPLPSHFEAAAEMVSEDDIAEMIACGPDPEVHAKMIRIVRRRGIRPHLHPPGRPRPGGFHALLREGRDPRPRALFVRCKRLRATVLCDALEHATEQEELVVPSRASARK